MLLLLPLATAAVVATAPAAALATKTFGLSATGEETAVLVPAGSGPFTAHVDVYSLTHRPITVALGVRPVTPPPGSAQPETGRNFATDIHLPTTSVRLAAQQHRTLPVVVHRPHSPTKQYAEITAAQISPATPAATAPLTLIVVLEPAPGIGSGPAGDAGRLAALSAAGALVLLVLGTLLVTRRRAAGGR